MAALSCLQESVNFGNFILGVLKHSQQSSKLRPNQPQCGSLSVLRMGPHTAGDPCWGWWVWLAKLANSNTASGKHGQQVRNQLGIALNVEYGVKE